ncbi:MAG TPA: protein kinase [Pyrinomonadaceae bacterium]|nr:protein kinase [Pyrinomonadaceae bacterium]
MAELSPGATLAHYRIVGKIGAGGMGEVYRAQDTELGRSVALKFLASDVAANQSRVKRFIQEAKAASSLNHPNILTVYEIGRADDTTFIATEFVDGVTLRQHLQKSLKLQEILDITIQIASALVAAHAAGIVHRDIKPENIMVRKDGLVKILDFGLAKLTENHDSSSTGSEAPTMALVNTEPGAVLGTVAYMSPEQAAGREVDARSDIWSLGVVLYEMLTSRAPFAGASKSHIIVAIIDREPLPVSRFSPQVPEALEWIVSEALTKDPEERCQTAKELMGKLKRLKQRIETGDSQLSSPPATNATSGKPQTSTAEPAVAAPNREMSGVEIVQSRISKHRTAFVAVLLLTLLVATAIGYAFYRLLTQPKQPGPIKMTALTTGGKINGEDINGQLSISPDGKYVVCAANDARQQASLWLRQVSTNSLVRIVAPANGGYLATTFSPDGEMIYYVAMLEQDQFVPTLYRVPLLGGNPAKVLDRVNSAVAFSRDGAQFAFVRKEHDATALMIANTDGSGEPRSVAAVRQPQEFSASGPSWSADGKRIACGMFNGEGAGYATVVEVPVTGGQPQPLGSQKWASIGRIIWLADNSGLIMTAQPESSSIGTQIWFLPAGSGEARRITNDLNGYGEVSLGVTADARAIATIQQVSTSSIWIASPNAPETQAHEIVKTNLADTVSWTPDEKIVYASRTGENWDIWIANADGSQTKQLTTDTFVDHEPSMCGDGRYIVFQSDRSGSRNIWRINSDGTNPKQLTTGNYGDSYPVCSPDGRSVVFMSLRLGGWGVWLVPIDGGEPAQITNRTSQFPSFSPDGKLITYFFPDDQANHQPKIGMISFTSGEIVKTLELPRTVQPIAFAWLPDGKSIAYLDSTSGVLNIWSVPLDGGPPRQLTNFTSGFINSFAIAPDGRVATYRFSVSRDIVLIKDFR